ncbi:hypothetical protein T552_04201 [Pneumocystis carinii B80]|uniref:Uncharacterized protein n=1 Tax=Pneumocystis carinii (strain B80) TaxID=1408658 RepID=A0A0W4ZBV1_PNEC8|nr:hypothetical protein T552_04201 [Pneumocystis carinii B80]KTW25928.1 hypothetical protein T552_04201 [Pneumocystis carinii B80]
MCKKPHISGTFFGLGLKLFILFTVYKLFFVCPLEELSGTQVLLCRNYYYLRSAVDPYLKPVYYRYAWEQVEIARPYLEKVRERVKGYSKPVVEHARRQYEGNIYPYVLNGKECIYRYIKKHLVPLKARYLRGYDEICRDRLVGCIEYLVRVYRMYIFPGIYLGYETVIYMYQSKMGLRFLVKKVYPCIIEGLFWLKHLFLTYVLPKMNDFWITHVNPQLDRIYDRIFQYKSVDYNIVSETSSSSSSNRQGTSKGNIMDEKKNTHAPYDQTEEQLFSEILSLWTDRLNKIGKEIEKALIEDLIDVFLPVIYKKEKAIIENLLNELNSLVDSEISKIKDKIISKENVLKNTFYNIDDIKTAGKKIHAKALEIRNYLKSIENDCKKKIIKKSKLYFNQIITFQSEMASLFEVFIRLSTKDENYKNVYKRYFDFRNLIDPIEKQFFDSILNSTLSGVKKIRNLSIKAELAVNNIAGLAARQLKDFKSANTSNNFIQKLYHNPIDEENNASSGLNEESEDQSMASDNSKQETKQENEKFESEHPALNQDSKSYYTEKQINTNSYPSDNKNFMENIDDISSQTDTLHIQKEAIRYINFLSNIY